MVDGLRLERPEMGAGLSKGNASHPERQYAPLAGSGAKAETRERGGSA